MSFSRNAAVLCFLLPPLWAVAGSLRVGPTRLELSARRPVAVLEVQNTGDQATLAQLDAFLWTQAESVDLLEPTAELITTPLVVSLAPGETRLVRVGLREPGGSVGQGGGPGGQAGGGSVGQATRSALERSYRLFVREVAPASLAEGGLRFAVRIGVPVFVLPGELRGATADGAGGDARGSQELTWRWLPGGPMRQPGGPVGQPDLAGCASVQIFNPSTRHDRVLAAEIRNAGGEVLWRASEPVYVLAGSKRSLQPALCAPSLHEATTLRLVTESHTFDLPVQAPALLADANAH